MNNEGRRLEIDIPTLIAISMLAWVLTNILHEIVGHAGSAALLGIPVRAVSTTTVYLEWDQVPSVGAYRIFHAAGTIVNLITGALALLVLRLRILKNSAPRYFLWLFATMSFTIAALNLVSAPLLGGGDWIEVTRGFEPVSLWIAIIVGLGVIMTVAGYALPLRLWMPDLRGNRGAQFKITVIPVVTLIVVQSLSIIGSPFANLPPASNHLLGSIFAYFHFILWAILVNVLPVPRSRNAVESIRLPRSNVSLAFGLVAALFFIFVLGPGLGPLEEDPRLG